MGDSSENASAFSSCVGIYRETIQCPAGAAGQVRPHRCFASRSWKRGVDCPETCKLEAPTKKRLLLLTEEAKFEVFPGGTARQAHRPPRGKRPICSGNQHYSLTEPIKK